MGNAGFTAKSAVAVYDECNIVWGGFQEIAIEHTSREANQVAHELARQAMLRKENCIQDDDPSSFIVHLLSNDVTILNQYSLPKGLSKEKKLGANKVVGYLLQAMIKQKRY